MGICISLTAKPIKPIIRKPTATALESSKNSSIVRVAFSPSGCRPKVGKYTFFIWLCASVQEEHAIFDKVAWHVKEFFNWVRHVDVVFVAEEIGCAGRFSEDVGCNQNAIS